MSFDKVFAANDESIEQAADCLRRGELVGIPTETVYGLAANALDSAAVAKIFLAKGRPPQNPLIVHLADPGQMAQVVAASLDNEIQNQIAALAPLWPGPLTLVLPRSDRVAVEVTAGRETVAVRVPANEITRRLIRRCGFPLAAPSANRSTYVSPTTAAHVAEGLGDRLAMILDGGPCDRGLESTIIQLHGDAATLLRPGAVTREELQSRLGVAVELLQVNDPNDLRAPGMMREHYAPRTRIQLISQTTADSIRGRCGRIAFAPVAKADAERFYRVQVLSSTGDLNEVARKLFAAIREFDSLGLDLILVDECDGVGIGQAIMDRLTRATAGHKPPAS